MHSPFLGITVIRPDVTISVEFVTRSAQRFVYGIFDAVTQQCVGSCSFGLDGWDLEFESTNGFDIERWAYLASRFYRIYANGGTPQPFTS